MDSTSMNNWQRQDKREQIRLLLTPREAAHALAISERTLWQLTKDGILESVRVGKRSVRYSQGALLRYVQNQEKSA